MLGQHRCLRGREFRRQVGRGAQVDHCRDFEPGPLQPLDGRGQLRVERAQCPPGMLTLVHRLRDLIQREPEINQTLERSVATASVRRPACFSLMVRVKRWRGAYGADPRERRRSRPPATRQPATLVGLPR